MSEKTTITEEDQTTSMTIIGGLTPPAGIQVAKILSEVFPESFTPDWILNNLSAPKPDENLLEKVKERTKKIIQESVKTRVAVLVACVYFHKDIDKFTEEMTLFAKSLNKTFVPINMLDEIAEKINEVLPNLKKKKVAIMWPSVTRNSGIAEKLYDKFNEKTEKIELSETMQKKLDNAMSQLNARKITKIEANQIFKQCAVSLADKGAEVLIIACTDFSTHFKNETHAGMKIIDPAILVAEKLGTEGYKKQD